MGSALSSESSSKIIDRQIETLQRQQDQLLAYARDMSEVYRQLRETQANLKDLYVSTLAALAAAIEARDPYLVGHSKTVASWAILVGQDLQLSSNHLETVRRAALLHDIGKIGVPDAVLKKPGPLDRYEFEQIRVHPELGHKILSSLGFLGDALLGIRHHHERYDGDGYPLGLRGENIPLIARILSACDALDAMLSTRPYREALDPSQAIDGLLRGGGSQFDPKIARRLARIVADRKRSQGGPPRKGGTP